MSQRIRKEIKRFCQCLLYMAAIRFCPAVRKRVLCEGRCAVVSDGAYERRSEHRLPAGALSVFGKVLGSLPFTVRRIERAGGIDVFIYKFREEVPEFGVRHRVEKSPAPAHPSRRVKMTRKTGFDLLRVTLNLARGDLEESTLAC